MAVRLQLTMGKANVTELKTIANLLLLYHASEEALTDGFELVICNYNLFFP